MGSLVAAVAPVVVGGVLGKDAAKRQAGATRDAASTAAQAQIEAAKIAADAAKFRPYNVYGGTGSGTFKGNNAYANLAPEYQALRDQYLNYGRKTAEGLNTYDPNATAQDIYSKLRSLSQYQRQQDQAGLFDTLAAKGVLGMSNGQGQNPFLRAYFDAQNNADLNREIQSYSLGQELANMQLGRAVQATQAGAGVDQLPLEYLNLGGGFGGRQAAAGAQGGELLSKAVNSGSGLQFNAAMAGAGAQANFWNQMIPQIQQGVRGLFSKSSPYTAAPAGYPLAASDVSLTADPYSMFSITS